MQSKVFTASKESFSMIENRDNIIILIVNDDTLSAQKSKSDNNKH